MSPSAYSPSDFLEFLANAMDDARTFFRQDVFRVVEPYRYVPDDADSSLHKAIRTRNSARDLCRACIEQGKADLEKSIQELLDIAPQIGAAYASIGSSLDALFEEAFRPVEACRQKNALDEVLSQEQRQEHRLGLFFLGNCEGYQCQLKNEAIILLACKCMAGAIAKIHELLLERQGTFPMPTPPSGEPSANP